MIIVPIAVVFKSVLHEKRLSSTIPPLLWLIGLVSNFSWFFNS